MKKIIATLLVLMTLSSFAREEAFQLSLTPEIAVHPTDTVIKGISLSIWGENEQKSIALGFVNGTQGDSSGFSFGLINYGDSYTGAMLGGINYTGGNFKGAQLAVMNYAEKIEKGFQLGFINYAETMTKGLQIGLINIIRNNDTFFNDFPDQIAPAMVIVNWRF